MEESGDTAGAYAKSYRDTATHGTFFCLCFVWKVVIIGTTALNYDVSVTEFRMGWTGAHFWLNWAVCACS